MRGSAPPSPETDGTATRGAVPGAPGAGDRRVTRSGVVLAILTLAIFLGALAIRGRLVFGAVAVAAIFVPMERLWSLHPQKILRRGWTTDLVHFVVNNLLTTIGLVIAVVAVGGALRAIVPSPLPASVAGRPAWAQLAEVLSYWAHRATHRVTLLWRFHKVHHSIEQMDWLAAARLHPVDQAFTRSCIVIPLFVLGYSRASFGGVIVLFTLQALFVHANVRFTFGPLRYVLATPEFHHWHHADDLAAYNSNFAGELPLVDALFGTLHLPRGEWPVGYGVADRAPDGYLRQLAWPFRPR